MKLNKLLIGASIIAASSVAVAAYASSTNGTLTLDNTATSVNLDVACNGHIGVPVEAGKVLVLNYGGPSVKTVYNALGLKTAGTCTFTDAATSKQVGQADVQLGGGTGKAPFYDFSTLSISNIVIAPGATITTSTAPQSGNTDSFVFTNKTTK